MLSDFCVRPPPPLSLPINKFVVDPEFPNEFPVNLVPKQTSFFLEVLAGFPLGGDDIRCQLKLFQNSFSYGSYHLD